MEERTPAERMPSRLPRIALGGVFGSSVVGIAVGCTLGYIFHTPSLLTTSIGYLTVMALNVCAIVLAIIGLCRERGHRYPLSTQRSIGAIIGASILLYLCFIAFQLVYMQETMACKKLHREMRYSIFERQTIPSPAELHTLQRRDPHHDVRLVWFPARQGRYGINGHLIGKRLQDIPQPERTVLLADCLPSSGIITRPDDIAWARHQGECVVTFCDGNTKVAPKDYVLNPWATPTPSPAD